MPKYTPDELKAIVLHYGSYEKARKKLGIGKATLVDAANADITRSGYQLKKETSDKISKHVNRLGTKSKQDIAQYEKMFDSVHGHPNIKKVIMNTKQNDRQAMAQTFKKYKNRLKQETLWTKIIGKLYDKYGWKRGQWSK